MTENIHSKPALRRNLLATRNAVPAELRKQWDDAIARRLAELRRHFSATLAIYWPMRGEPDLRDWYAEQASCGTSLSLPVIADPDAPLRFAAWKPGDALVKDAMGTSIPAHIDNFLQPETVLIPCVGFNAANFRLGFGGGFYDRTLASSTRPFAIGIAYECGRAEFVSEPHDIPLDLIVTEASTYEITRRA